MPSDLIGGVIQMITRRAVLSMTIHRALEPHRPVLYWESTVPSSRASRAAANACILAKESMVRPTSG